MLVVVLLVSVSAGCAAGPRASEPPYMRSFRIGAFDTALEQARRSPRDEWARLVAAMSLHALGRGDDAETDLQTLSGSADAAIRGRAQATLALVAYDRGETAVAARYLDSAVRDLESPEKDRAMSFRRAIAGAPAGEPSGRTGGAWSVQVGAFQNATRAERAARSGRARVWPSPIEVQEETSAGRTLHVVRVGRFGTRQEAERFAEQVGGFVRPVE